jgi:hypothetical protein
MAVIKAATRPPVHDSAVATVSPLVRQDAMRSAARLKNTSGNMPRFPARGVTPETTDEHARSRTESFVLAKSPSLGRALIITYNARGVRGYSLLSRAEQIPASIRRGDRVLLAASATGSAARAGQQSPRGGGRMRRRRQGVQGPTALNARNPAKSRNISYRLGTQGLITPAIPSPRRQFAPLSLPSRLYIFILRLSRQAC